jgi:hypothetical protein
MPLHPVIMNVVGVCIRDARTGGQWICDHYLDGSVPKGIADIVAPIANLRKMALWSPLPAVAGASLVLWCLFMVFRNTERVKKGLLCLLWFSCAMAIVGAVVPFLIVRATRAVAPICKSPVEMEVKMNTFIATWVAVGTHVAYVCVASWWDKHVGGTYGLA